MHVSITCRQDLNTLSVICNTDQSSTLVHTNSCHGDDCKVERRYVSPPEIDLSEVEVRVVAQSQAPDPCVPLLRWRDCGCEVVEDARCSMSTVQFDCDQLNDPRKEVVYADILLHPLEEFEDISSSV